LEQILKRITKGWQKILALEEAAKAYKLPARWPAANLGAFEFWINDPSQAGPALKEISQTFVNFGTRAVWGKNLHSKIRRSWKE
jgi:hypothetical protein